MAQRSYATGVSVSLLGMMNLVVDLVPRLNSAKKPAEFPHLCPECTDPTGIKQLYTCAVDPNHGPYEDRSLLPQALKVDKDTLIPVSPEKIEEIRTEGLLNKGDMTLIVVPAEQVEAQTQPSAAGYRLRPGKATEKVYCMVRDLVRHSEYALVGELNLRNVQKLYRLVVWNDQLCLQELIRPDEIAPADEIEGEYDARLLEKAEQVIAALAEDFDPAEFRNQVKERANALAASGNGAVTVTTGTPKPAADSTDGLLAALEASLAQAKPTKGKTKAKK